MATDEPTPAQPPRQLTKEYNKDDKYRILCLDGGGSKGFYTLGILDEIEGMLGCHLYKRFDLVYGTSTGSIIAALIALGYTVEEIYQLYKTYVPTVMRPRSKEAKSAALAKLAKEILGEKVFTDVKTGLGIVATKWHTEQPMIFKHSVEVAHGRHGTFVPGFGVTIAQAVLASCSAYPFFNRTTLTTAQGDRVELIDGGYSANNPTLYALTDALVALKKNQADLRIVSLGCGVYPEPKPRDLMGWLSKTPVGQLMQKTFEINTQSMDALRKVLFKDVPTIRISDTFSKPELATDLLEHDLTKLNLVRQQGRMSYADREVELKEFLL